VGNVKKLKKNYLIHLQKQPEISLTVKTSSCCDIQNHAGVKQEREVLCWHFIKLSFYELHDELHHEQTDREETNSRR
jgi:hypothetical protein